MGQCGSPGTSEPVLPIPLGCCTHPPRRRHIPRHIACESIGDYIAGPNHVLPTNGTARFSSPLGTEDFLKRSSIISYTEAGLAVSVPRPCGWLVSRD